MPSTDSKEFDIIIFGASGLTGRYAIEELSQCVSEYPGLKWALAGRNIEKLKNALESVQKLLPQGIDIRKTPILKADAQDNCSIHEMCKRTKLLLNCVGPYNIHGGEMIVATCIECQTHCIDISAEIKYLDEVQANYFKPAREAGVYVVEACGLGSLPTDYGIAVLMKKFPGDLFSVEYFVEFLEGPHGRCTGYGTYSSAVDSMTDYLKSDKFERQVVEKVFKKKPVETGFSIRKWIAKLVKYSWKEKAFCLKYIGPDVRTIKRSQMFRANFLNKEKHIKINGYMKPQSILSMFLMIYASLALVVLSIFAVGRFLMRKYPSFFTAGLFSKTGPTRQQILEGGTRITFYAEGWKTEESGFLKRTKKPDKKIKMVINGQEPAYAFTGVCMIQACLTVLFEHDKIPLEGGVYTPGVAFENTSLQKRLEKRGVTFKFANIE